MAILALGPILLGLALALVAVLIIAGEVIGKAMVAFADVVWEYIRPANHHRAVRQLS